MTKIYKINYHSFVDVITNSSTEIYTTTSEDTIEAVKQLINCFLTTTSNNLSWDDLFSDIILLPTDESVIKYALEDLVYDNNLPNVTIKMLGEMSKYDIVKKYLEVKDELDLDVTDSENGPFNIFLIPLDDSKTELASHFNSLIKVFQAEAFYS